MDRTKTYRTWHVYQSDADELAHLAAFHGVSHNQLVRYLLHQALEAVRRGEIKIQAKPATYEIVWPD